MTDAVVTYSAALTAEELDANSEVTQSALLFVYGPPPPHHITTSAVLEASEVPASADVTQSAVLFLYNEFDDGKKETQCWKITRSDGEILAFTTHDEDVEFLGTTYERCDALRSSAISGTAASGAATGDVQLAGILSYDRVTKEDIYAGRYDNAHVEVYLVDWQTGLGRILTRGIICRTLQRENDYVLTALTGGARMEQQPLLDVYTPSCRYTLGDSRCQVDVEALRLSGAVTAVPAANVVSTSRRRIFIDAGRTESAETFQNGRLTWTSGANIGLTLEVKTFAAGVATLWMPAPFNIQVGDTYTIVPGCGKRFTEDCVGRYANGDNFGGFPDIPGTDEINQTPEPH